MFRAMLREELVDHVQAKVGRTEDAAARERSPNVEGQLDQMFERTADLLQIRLDVDQYGAPLHRRVANGTASVLRRIIVVGRGGVAGEKDVPLRADDDRGLPHGIKRSPLY